MSPEEKLHLSSARDLLTLVEVPMSPEEKLQDADLVEARELSLSSLYEFPLTDNAGVAFAWNYGGTPRFAHMEDRRLDSSRMQHFNQQLKEESLPEYL
jgi:hypothetical protein